MRIPRWAFAVVLFLAIHQGTAAADEVIAIEKGLVIRPIHAQDRRAFEALPQGVVILRNPPLDPKPAASAFSYAHARSIFVFPAENGLYIMSTGPVLDSPDAVEIRRLDRRGNQFHLQVAHTKVRLQDAPLLRNVTWRPMVAVSLPGALPHGAYSVQVTWQPVERIPGGLPLPAPETSQTIRFEISGR